MLSVLMNGISIGAVYAMIAVGFALIFSVLKFSNFSHGGLISVSAYIGLFSSMYLKTNFILTLIVAMLGGGLLGIFVEFTGFRRLRNSRAPLIYYFISSITLGLLFENILTIINGTNFYMYPPLFKMSTFNIFGFTASMLDVIMAVVSIISLLALSFVIKRTRIGLAIRTVSIDNVTSTLMGINTKQVIQVSFFLAGMLAGVSGVLLGISYTVFPQLGGLVIKGFVASVIGGLGSISGAVIGAFLLGIIEVILVMTIGASLSPVVIFGLMLIFLILRPRGISGIFVSEKA